MPANGTHTVVHGLLTAMLGLAYAVVVIFLAQFPSALGRGSGLAVAISTLAVAGLLWPAWRHLQRTLNRRHRALGGRPQGRS